METQRAPIQQKPEGGRSSAWLMDRTAATILLALILVVTVIYCRHDFGQAGMTEGSLWTMKIDWRHCADMVILGDSRSLMDVFPAVMETHFPGLRILNFSFGALGYTERYLRAAERVLDPDSAQKTIILGISPLTLTRGAVEENTFDITMNKPDMNKRRTRLFGRLLYILRPTQIHEILDTLRGKKITVRHVRNFRRDGSAACYMVPENPRQALSVYENAFEPKAYGPVNREVIDVIIRMVEEWARKGIEVYAFRPPTFPELVELENEKSHYDEEDLANRVEQAGGTWFRFHEGQFRTFDGSHLHPEGARQFSHELAEKILSARRNPNQNDVFRWNHDPLSDHSIILARFTE